MFNLINWEYPNYNPPRINLYSAERLYTGNYQYSVQDRFSHATSENQDNEMHFMTHFITTDISTNWGAVVLAGQGADNTLNTGRPQFHVYKFFPAVDSTYEYVAPCSNRGICDTDSGTCDCFSGYTSDSCSEQSSLAV
jgi:hypothetical protein